MNNEPNKPIKADELTEKELEGIVGGKENAGGSETSVAMKVEAPGVDGPK